MLITAINDHYLKYTIPGLITGKISDFSGLFYFPLFVAAVVILAGKLFGKQYYLNKTFLIVIIILTDTLFAFIKLSPGFSQWFTFYFSNFLFPIQIVSDPTDLVALVSSLLCYQFAKKYFKAIKAA